MKSILLGLLFSAVAINAKQTCPNNSGGGTIAPAGPDVSPNNNNGIDVLLPNARRRRCAPNAAPVECSGGDALANCVDVLFLMDRSHSVTGGDVLFNVQAQTTLQYSESIMLTIANELKKSQNGDKIAEIGLVTFSTTSTSGRWYYPLTQGGINEKNLLEFSNKVLGVCQVNGDKDYTNPIDAYKLALQKQFPRRRGINQSGQRCEVPLVVMLITDGTPTTQKGPSYPNIPFKEEYNYCPNVDLVTSALKQANIVKSEDAVTLVTVGIGSRLECTCPVQTYGANPFFQNCNSKWSISSCFLRESSTDTGGPAFHPDFYFPTLNKPKKQAEVADAVSQIVCGENGYPNDYGLMQAIRRVAVSNVQNCCFGTSPPVDTPAPTKPTKSPKGPPSPPTTPNPTPKLTQKPDGNNVDLMILLDTSGSIFGNNPEEAKEPTLCAGVGVGASPIFPAAVNGFFPTGGYYPITATGAIQPDACWLVFMALIRDIVQKLVDPSGGKALMPWAAQDGNGQGLRLSVTAFWCDGKQTLPRTESIVPIGGTGGSFFDGTGMTDDFTYVDTFTNPNAVSPPFNTLFNTLVKYKQPAGTGTGTCPDYSLADFINLVEQTWQESAIAGRTNRVLLTISDLMMYDAVRNPIGVIKTQVSALSKRCVVPFAFSPIGPNLIAASYDDKFACSNPPCCTGQNICPKSNQAKQYALLMTNFEQQNTLFYLYGTNGGQFVPTPPGNVPSVATNFLGKMFNFAFPITSNDPVCSNPASFGNAGIDNRFCGYQKGVCLKQCTYSQAIQRDLKKGGPDLLLKDQFFMEGCSPQPQRQACEFLSGGKGCQQSS